MARRYRTRSRRGLSFRDRRRRSLRVRVGALLALACAVGAVAAVTESLVLDSSRNEPARGSAAKPRSAARTPATQPELTERAPALRQPRLRWRSSRALGTPSAGSLVRGVQLPGSGEHFFTWDPILRAAPSRGWRRFGTDDLVRTLLRVTARFGTSHPRAAPIGVGDLSRPRGGNFGARYGRIGHATHQNGLDADVYYPRLDRRRRPPAGAADIDRRLAQKLVDGFVRAGAKSVLVGPGTGLGGPRGVVRIATGHDDHMHVTIS